MKIISSILIILLSLITSHAASHTVRMVANTFSPASLTVQTGDSVTWVNDDPRAHDTVSGRNGVPDGVWQSSLLSRGGTFSFTFNVPAGNYPYYCTPHVQIGMVGNITVAPPANNPPTLSITSPANGAVFTAPASFDFTANASDAQGLSGVEFFNNGQSLGFIGAAPFRVPVTLNQPGTYTLSAVATDTGGATARSEITVTVNNRPNTPPTIAISSPQNNARFVAPANFTAVANPTDAEGINNVEFFLNGASQGTVATAPYSLPVSIVVPGNYTLSAVVTDTAGVTASSALQIVVEEPPRGTLIVVISSPTNSQEFLVGTGIPIAATATNELATVTGVSFSVDGLFFETDTASPFAATVTGLPSGEHTINAVATDSRGQVASNSVRVIVLEPVNQPPSVTLALTNSPPPFRAGNTITLVIRPNDPDGTVTNVLLILPNGLRASPIPSNLILFEAPLREGTNRFTAIVTDNRGATATNIFSLVSGAVSTIGGSEILLANDAGQLQVLPVSGSTISPGFLIDGGKPLGPQWRVAGRADFDGDSRPEILLQYEDGTLALWYTDGPSLLRFESLEHLPPFGRAWSIAAIGDLDGNGTADLIWRHTLGYVAYYLLSGTTFIKGDLLQSDPVPLDWHLRGSDDVNNDGHDDLVWQASNGTVGVWTIRSATVTSKWTVDAFGLSSQSLVGVFDFDSDALSNFLFQNSSGGLEAREMNGTSFKFSGSSVPAGWRVITVSPRAPSRSTPTVQITSAANGVTTNGLAFLVQATPSDSGSRIAHVEFWIVVTNVLTLLGFDGASPYSISSAPLPPGSYIIRAIAQNLEGRRATNNLSISIQPPPTAALDVYHQTNGNIQLNASKLSAGYTYKLLWSTNLVQWYASTTLVATSQSHTIVVTNSNPGSKFYRIAR